MEVKNLTISYQKNGHKVSLHADQFLIEHNAFHSQVRVTEADSVKNWIIAGNLDKNNHSASF